MLISTFSRLPESAVSEVHLHIGLPQTLSLGRFGGAALSEDRRYLAAADWNGAQVWDLQQVPTRSFRVSHPMATSVALSSDGKWLATGAWHGIGTATKIWSAYSGGLLAELPVQGTAAVRFSPDARWLVTGTGEEYRFWETGSWKPHHAVRLKIAKEGYEMAFSPDSTMLAIRQGHTGVQLVESFTGRPLGNLTGAGQFPISFSPDGTKLLTGDDQATLRIWDLRVIRHELAAMKLDWDLPPIPQSVQERTPKKIGRHRRQPSRSGFHPGGSRATAERFKVMANHASVVYGVTGLAQLYVPGVRKRKVAAVIGLRASHASQVRYAFSTFIIFPDRKTSLQGLRLGESLAIQVVFTQGCTVTKYEPGSTPALQVRI